MWRVITSGVIEESQIRLAGEKNAQVTYSQAGPSQGAGGLRRATGGPSKHQTSPLRNTRPCSLRASVCMRGSPNGPTILLSSVVSNPVTTWMTG